jgi:hypothetical protein
VPCSSSAASLNWTLRQGSGVVLKLDGGAPAAQNLRNSDPQPTFLTDGLDSCSEDFTDTSQSTDECFRWFL